MLASIKDWSFLNEVYWEIKMGMKKPAKPMPPPKPVKKPAKRGC